MDGIDPKARRMLVKGVFSPSENVQFSDAILIEIRTFFSVFASPSEAKPMKRMMRKE